MHISQENNNSFLASLNVFNNNNNISNVDLCYHHFNALALFLTVQLLGVLNWNGTNEGTFLCLHSSSDSTEIQIGHSGLVGAMGKAGIWSFQHRHLVVRDSQVPVDFNHCRVSKLENKWGSDLGFLPFTTCADDSWVKFMIRETSWSLSISSASPRNL